MLTPPSRPRCEALERRTLLALAAGSLDPSFNGTGILTTSLGSDVTINKAAVQADSKIVIVGAIGKTGDYFTPGTRDFFISRYNADGTLDQTFGTKGVVRSDFGGDDFANDVAIDNQGRIVVAGGGGSGADFAVARYLPSGALDKTFAKVGKRLIKFGGVEACGTIAIDAHGRIVLGGAQDKPNSLYDTRSALARLTSDGSLDKSFSGDGQLMLSAFDNIADAAIDPKGKIVVTGGFIDHGRASEFTRAGRLLQNGALDPSFGFNGVADDLVTDDSFGAAVAAPSPDVVIVAYVNEAAGTAPLGGCLELTDNGNTQTPLADFQRALAGAPPTDILVQPDGRLIVAASAWTQTPSGSDVEQSGFLLARFTSPATGVPALDKSFGKSGVVYTPIPIPSGADSTALYGAALDPQGGTVAVGNFYNTASTRTFGSVIARYLTAAPPSPKPNTVVKIGREVIVTGTAAHDDVFVETGGDESGTFVDITLNGRGYEFLFDQVGSVTVNTLGGNDEVSTVFGAPGLVINCGDGDDTVNLSEAVANIYGDAGDDTVDMVDSDCFFDGGSGTDSIYRDAGVPGTLDISKMPGLENATNYEGDLIGNDLNNVLRLDVGGYSIIGGAGNDTILSPGAATIYAGAGNDVIVENYGDDFIDAGSGNDVIDAAPGGSTIHGGSGNDRIVARNEDPDEGDVLFGDAGNDTLIGGEGDDTLDGGSGADLMKGGGGFDTVDYSSRTKNLIVGIGTAADDGEAGEHDNVWTDVEKVIGGSGNDLLRGNATANVLLGLAGNDTLDGGGGNDALFGGSGNDHLIGGAGNDYMEGQAGNDQFFARDGQRDTLTGGDGSDSASVDNSAKLKDLWSEVETLLK